jgi:hypothetical protein
MVSARAPSGLPFFGFFPILPVRERHSAPLPHREDSEGRAPETTGADRSDRSAHVIAPQDAGPGLLALLGRAGEPGQNPKRVCKPAVVASPLGEPGSIATQACQ